MSENQDLLSSADTIALALCVDVSMLCLWPKEQSNQRGQRRDDHREPEPHINGAGRSVDCKDNSRKQSSKPSGADMVWEGHGCVPDTGWEKFDQRCCLRAIERAGSDYEQRHHANDAEFFSEHARDFR